MNEKVNGKSNFGVRGWILTIYTFLIYFVITCIPQQLFNSTGTYYTDTLGWSNVTLQGVLTIGGIFSVIMILITGQLTLKKSVRKVALTLGVLWVVFCLLTGVSSNIVVFCIALVLTRCCGDAMAFSTNGALIANWFPKKRGLVMGWATFGFPLASGLGMLIMTGCYNAMGGIMGAFLPIAVLAVVAIILLAVFLRDHPEQCGCAPDNEKNGTPANAAEFEHAGPGVWTTGKCLKTKELWLVALSIGTMMFSSGFMSQVGAAITSLGYSPDIIAPVMMGIMIVCCAGSYVCGLLDVKLGTRTAILITDGLLLLMGIFAQFDNIVMLFISFACMSVVLGGGSNYLVSWVSAIWGRKNFKPVYRWAITITNIFSAIATLVIAAIAAATSFKIAFLFASLLAVIGAILALCVKKDTSYVDNMVTNK